jgi:hypothetical protein
MFKHTAQLVVVATLSSSVVAGPMAVAHADSGTGCLPQQQSACDSLQTAFDAQAFLVTHIDRYSDADLAQQAPTLAGDLLNEVQAAVDAAQPFLSQWRANGAGSADSALSEARGVVATLQDGSATPKEQRTQSVLLLDNLGADLSGLLASAQTSATTVPPITDLEAEYEAPYDLGAPTPALETDPTQIEETEQKLSDIQTDASGIAIINAEFLATGNTNLFHPPCAQGDDCVAKAGSTPIVLHPEGEGWATWTYKNAAGNVVYRPYWTCGPSSTRAMLQGLTNTNYTEPTVNGWEGTTTQGTNTGNIPTALNNHFSRYDHFVLYKPKTGTDLVGALIKDQHNGQLPHALISNVLTSSLPFWNGHHTTHYDLVYAYDNYGSDVWMGEEWDSTYNLGRTPSYGDPYGSHFISADTAQHAIASSPSHDVIA